MTDPAARQRRQAAYQLGLQRGAAAELRTQLDRARQDVELGWWYWAKRWASDRRSPRRSVVRGPKVTVITPVYRTDPAHLAACLDSVAAQTYADWEHVLVDDGSNDDRITDLLTTRVAADRRVAVHTHERNQGIVAASATALAAATGDLVVLLDHDDVLDPRALERLTGALTNNAAAVLAYSDHDVLRPDGRYTEPFFKPDFSPERLRHHNYVLHCVMARRDDVMAVGGFRPGFDGAQDHDLLLRLCERGEVVHVPEVLYHWRQAPASVALDAAAKPGAYDAGVRAVQEHCDRVGIVADVVMSDTPGVYRLRRRAASPLPRVSVVIPTNGSSREVWGERRCLVVEAVRSIVEHSTYPDIEFVVVADTGTPPPAIEQLERFESVRIVDFGGSFNFAIKCNLGAAAASGSVLLFLNDDTELIAPDSVGEMVALAVEDDVGLVGAKLLYEDGTLQHAGHVYPGLATHICLGYPGDHPLPASMGRVVRECSGVTAAAMMVMVERFGSLGGFDEGLPGNFNDVDLSLRARSAGYRVLWTPYASWHHFESSTRDPSTESAERDLLVSRWRHQLEHDPYFNPNLQPHRSDWLERPGRSGAPPYVRDERGRRRFG